MNNNDEIKNLSKIKIYLYLKKLWIYEINTKEDFPKIPFNYNDLVESIIKLNRTDKLIFIYFYRKFINDMLFEEEKIIKLNNDDKNNNNLAFYFYLYLLIMDNPDIINYYYPIDYIIEINKKLKNIDKSQYQYQFIILLKIIKELIYFYEQNDYDDENESENENEELKKIKNEIEDISENIFENNNYNIKDIKSKNIDKIYIEVISGLIKTKQIENDETTNNIIKQLDLENIYITKEMFDELYKILECKEEGYIKEYEILNEDDLFCNEKLNFYYILFKYIFKNQIYIYQIPLFYKLRKFIIKQLKSNKSNYKNIIDNNIKDKLKFIIKYLLDSEYYFKKYENEIILEKEKNELIQNNDIKLKIINVNKKGMYNNNNDSKSIKVQK